MLSNSLLGASGAFENLAGMLGKAVAPKAFDNLYFNFVMPPGITWGVILLVGVFFGGLIGAATSGTLQWGKKDRANSDAQWKRIFGPQVWKRWVLGFVGAIILEYAAGIAGGCTSGLAISGGMLAGARGLPLHCRDVRLRHRHGADRVSQPVLAQGELK